MLRKGITISFLVLYLAFLILPAYPLMHYYFLASGRNYIPVMKQKNYTNADHAKTGDMAYLSALLKSADNKNNTGKKAQNPPPTNNEINNLVYLVSSNFQLSLVAPGVPLLFQIYSEAPLERYLKVLLPPPNRA